MPEAETIRSIKTAKFRRAAILDLDMVDYPQSLILQRELQNMRISGRIEDCFITLEHPPTITLGKDGGQENLLVSEDWLSNNGFGVYQAERGGNVTYHGPGQLVGYIIADLKNYGQDLHLLVNNLEEVIIRTLGRFGIKSHRKVGFPGVWIGKEKIASIGISVSRWVTMHGFALNIDPDMSHFSIMNPCGLQEIKMTSVQNIRPVSFQEIKSTLVEEMAEIFHWELAVPGDSIRTVLDQCKIKPRNFRPGWLAVSAPAPGVMKNMTRILARGKLNTVCKEACCPNAAECFEAGTATFMILGDICTRNCRFCSVKSGVPRQPDPREPRSLAGTVKELGLKHVVITSVTRDDLPDGGANHFSSVIYAVRDINPHVTVEVLVPDFKGSASALACTLAAGPDVLGHNVETVPRLYGEARPGAGYHRSLRFLATAKKLAPNITTKSSLMVGLGERPEEVLDVMDDLRAVGCDYITIGQYLQPTPGHLPVQNYVSPGMYEWYKEQCIRKGFARALCGPFVRSSYHAKP